MKKRKIVSLLLAMVFVVSLVPVLPVTADAAGVTKTGGASDYLDGLTIGGEVITDCTDEMQGDGWRVDGNVIFLLYYDGSGIIIDAKPGIASISIVVTTSSKIMSGLYGIQCDTGLYLTLDGSTLDIDAGYIGIACNGGLFFQDGSDPGKVNITCRDKGNGYAAISQSHYSMDFMTLEPNIRLNINWVTNSDEDVHGLKDVSVIKGDSSDKVGVASVVVKNSGSGQAYAARTMLDPKQSYVDSLKSRATVYNPDQEHLFINMYGIDALDITVAQPAVGNTPSFTATASPDLITITELEWCKDGPNPMSAADTYEAGHSYQPVFSYKLKAGAEFLEDAQITVNGSQATSTMYLIFGREYSLSLDHDISAVEVSVTPPVAGTMPTFTATTDSTECTVTDGKLAAWIDTATDAHLSETDAFEAGHTYQALIWLKPNKGNNLTDGTEVTINGEKATLEAKGGSSCMYSYDFTVAEPSDATHTVNVGSLTVRQDPDSSSPRIGGLTQGDEVKVLETQGEWSKIKYQDGYGWVMSQYLTANFTFTTQPVSGTAKKTEVYTFSWATNETPDDVFLMEWYQEMNAWSAENITIDPATWVATYYDFIADGNISRYRIKAIKGSESIYSDEFTVTWKEDTPAIAFTKQPVSGVAKKTEDFTYTWDLNDTPDSLVIQAWFGDSWHDGSSLMGKTSDTVSFSETISKYRIKAMKGSETIYSNEFTVTWTEDSAEQPNPFTDVSKSDPYYDAVLWAYYHAPQITNGMTDTTFGPELTVTRGQCVTFLWRAMGEPEPSGGKNPFTDVPSDQYYYKAVLWAVEKGITDGVTDTTFEPDTTLSTQHIITFLYRTLNPGKDGWSGEAAVWAGKDDGGKPFGVDIAVNNKTDCPRWCVVQFLYKTVK